MAEAKGNAFYLLSRQELALIGITFLWGATFLIIHLAMRSCGPLFFVGFRFVLAGIFASIIFWRSLKNISMHDIFAGTVIGIPIFLGYSLQTAGLKTIASSQSAFITAVYVPLVPLLQWIILRKKPRLTSFIGISFAFIGLLLISGQGIHAIDFSKGEILTLLSAFAIASEIVFISLFAGRVDSRRVTVVQLFVAGFLSFVAMPVNGETVPDFSWGWVSAGLGLAAMSALIQLTMNWAQRSVSPTRATIIYTGEPVWAGLVGRIAGERLPHLAILGAFCIIVGILVSELKPKKRVTAQE
ncbi:DMT family transporter [Bartonella apihabitans]|uniref:DMT family transporter n=1 Tax=uncultured Bartonella sp. TaxID=104108 RepID=UPI0025FF7E00|nr:DMT family transporter [Bartonella apihabitans]WLT08578.1 DMT family transporter [Bartonella apihabitans]